MDRPVWNVLIEDQITHQFKIWNIFEHDRFFQSCCDAYKIFVKDRFSERIPYAIHALGNFRKKITDSASFCFQHKPQWQLFVMSINNKTVNKTIDVYYQIIMNFDNISAKFLDWAKNNIGDN